nr:polysaccharide biosynthesis C-terminal domain-containing protein [Colwellia sp. E2M01]
MDVLPWAILSGGIFAILYNYINHYFIIADKTGFLIYIDSITAVVICIIAFPLIDIFGLKGGVIAMCLASASVAISMLIYLLKCTEFIFPVKPFLKISFSVLIMYILTVYTQSFFANTIYKLTTSIVVGIFVYIVCSAFIYRKQIVSYMSKSFEIKRKEV